MGNDIAPRTIEVTLEGAPVPVTLRGSGPAILLVQGGAARSRGYWLDIPQRLAETATVITLDRPGVGTNLNSGSAFSLARQADHLAVVIRAVTDAPVLAVGHSLGGPVLMQLALDHPDLVAGLVLVDPTPTTSREALERITRLARVVASIVRVPGMATLFDAAVTLSFRGHVPAEVRSSAAYREAVAVMTEDDSIPRLPGILRGIEADAETLTARLREHPIDAGGVLISADQKTNRKMRPLHAEMAQLAGLSHEVWAGTTHNLYLEQPDRLVDTIRRVRAH